MVSNPRTKLGFPQLVVPVSQGRLNLNGTEDFTEEGAVQLRRPSWVPSDTDDLDTPSASRREEGTSCPQVLRVAESQ